MEWLIPPNDNGCPGFRVGDKIVHDSGETGIVITREDHNKNNEYGTYAFERSDLTRWIPVREDLRRKVDGWSIGATKIVSRKQRVLVRGNELYMEDA